MENDREYVNVELGYAGASGYSGGQGTSSQYENMEPSPDLRYGARGVDNLAYGSPTGTPSTGYQPQDIQLNTSKSTPFQ